MQRFVLGGKPDTASDSERPAALSLPAAGAAQAIVSAGFEAVIIPNALEDDEIRTDLAALEAEIKRLGAHHTSHIRTVGHHTHTSPLKITVQYVGSHVP